MTEEIYLKLDEIMRIYRSGNKEMADRLLNELSARVTQDNKAFWDE